MAVTPVMSAFPSNPGNETPVMSATLSTPFNPTFSTQQQQGEGKHQLLLPALALPKAVGGLATAILLDAPN